MAEEKEWIEGFGTIQASEPTTICDVANTFSYISKETPALKEVEKLLKDLGYADAGTYDEEGRWVPPCGLRKRINYGSFVPKEEAEKKPEWNLTILTWNLWDAHIDYRRCCPEISRRLRELHDKLAEEVK